MTSLEAILLALAAWRVTRLVVDDEIARPAREAIARRLPDGRLSYLVECPHCVSCWAALGLVAVWQWAPSWGLAWVALVVVPAVAAVTSLFALILPPE